MINKTKTGWVGFFDILGYVNLLERNEPECIAEEVIPILSSVKDKDSLLEDAHFLFTLLYGTEISIPIDITNKVATLHSLVFSDTILLTMPIEEDENYQLISAMIFQMACSRLQTKLFEAGLPLRGAIEYGKYYIQDTCFAGRTIVNAYHLSQRLELSACVLADSASNRYRMLIGSAPPVLDFSKDVWFVREYYVPMKGGDSHMLTIKAPVLQEKQSDLRDQVMASFWGYKKDISQGILQKALNTEQWLRYMDHKKSK